MIQLPAAAFATLLDGQLIFPVHPGYDAESAYSDVTLFHGQGRQPAPVRMARILAQQSPLYVIVDLLTAGIELDRPLPHKVYLYNWLPDDAIELASPVFIPQNSPIDVWPIIASAWGQNALVCIYSRTGPRELLEQLRRVARQESVNADGAKVERVLGFAKPSILGPLAKHGAPEVVGALMTGIDAILFEGESPDQWTVCSGRGFARALDRLGFQAVSTEPLPNHAE